MSTFSIKVNKVILNYFFIFFSFFFFFFFEYDSGGSLWVFGKYEWNSIEGECQDGISGGFDGGLNESEDDTWGDRGWENYIYEVDLWTIVFDWKWNCEQLLGIKELQM